MADGQKTTEQPIIFKKIVKGGHGHHGGAWKVAYADFVTAMMAFFIVMWILSSSTETQEAVTAYYDDPGAFLFLYGKHTLPIDLGLKPKPGNKPGNNVGSGQGKSKYTSGGDTETDERGRYIAQFAEQAVQDSMLATERVDEIRKQVEAGMTALAEKIPNLEDAIKSISISNIDEGLRIELIETDDNLFFMLGASNLKKEITDILKILGSEIGKLPNYVEIEGHTDARGYSRNASYTNFELSADRANSARRVLERYGLWDGQIQKVTGYADKNLRLPNSPFDNTNRRISIIIKHLTVKDFLPIN